MYIYLIDSLFSFVRILLEQPGKLSNGEMFHLKFEFEKEKKSIFTGTPTFCMYDVTF